MEHINVEPSLQGYVSIAGLFRQSIVSKLKSQDDIQKLRSLIEISVYLAINHPEEYHKMMNPLGSK
jgi:hypothetical protein